MDRRNHSSCVAIDDGGAEGENPNDTADARAFRARREF